MLSYSIKMWMWYIKSIRGLVKGRKLLGEVIRSFQDKDTRIKEYCTPFDSALSELILSICRNLSKNLLI